MIWLSNWVSIARVVACFFKRAGRGQQWLQPTPSRKRPVFVLAGPTRPISAVEQPQELGRWYCPLNLQFRSGTAFEEIARWQAGAQTWTQPWTLQPDQRVVKILSPLFVSAGIDYGDSDFEEYNWEHATRVLGHVVMYHWCTGPAHHNSDITHQLHGGDSNQIGWGALRWQEMFATDEVLFGTIVFFLSTIFTLFSTLQS